MSQGAESTFIPYIRADGQKTVPNSITLFGLSGGHQRWTDIRVPQSILDSPLEDQLARLPELMAEYRKRYKRQVPFFGKLRGFRFVLALDHFEFDADGRLLQRVPKPFRSGLCCVELR